MLRHASRPYCHKNGTQRLEYKHLIMHQITLFQDKKSKNFVPSQTPPPVGRGHRLPTPTPSAPTAIRSSSLWRLIPAAPPFRKSWIRHWRHAWAIVQTASFFTNLCCLIIIIHGPGFLLRKYEDISNDYFTNGIYLYSNTFSLCFTHCCAKWHICLLNSWFAYCLCVCLLYLYCLFLVNAILWYCIYYVLVLCTRSDGEQTYMYRESETQTNTQI